MKRSPAEDDVLAEGIPGRRSRLSRSTVGRIWTTFGLKSHQTETVGLSDDL
jgi:hypothetical protein